MIEERGCKLEFLPPYSPDYNPIEYSFSAIKAALKTTRGFLKGNETTNEFGEMIIELTRQIVTPEMAKNQFGHCGILVD
jgi:transposase